MQKGDQSGNLVNLARRRQFFSKFASAIMAGGLTAGYGVFIAYAGRFLFPSGHATTAWQFVSTLSQMKLGESLEYETPAGAKIVVARQRAGDTAEDFIALSSVCPHLGCAVHWEAQNDRFFCPCHNGAFDATGKPTEGPPAAANQELTQFPLRVARGMLFIEVPRDSLSTPQES